MTGRLILGKESNRSKKTPNKRRINHVDEDCPWMSEKTTVYTRMTNQQILTLIFTYADRQMDLARYTDKIDTAIQKIDPLLEEYPNSHLLSRKKYLLLTGKEIFQEISRNHNVYNPGLTISLRDYGRTMIKKLMHGLSFDQRNQAESISSDSDSDNIIDDYDKAFDKVLDEYFNTDPDKKGRLQRRIEKEIQEGDRSMEANCDAYRKLIDEFKSKLKIPMSRTKNLYYQSCLFFLLVAESTLRQAASSSCIERKFADALRSTERKRVKLTSEHIGSEVFLRCLNQEKAAIKQLALLVGYDSKNYNRMMTALNSIDDEDDTFDVSIIIKSI